MVLTINRQKLKYDFVITKGIHNKEKSLIIQFEKSTKQVWSSHFFK